MTACAVTANSSFASSVGEGVLSIVLTIVRYSQHHTPDQPELPKQTARKPMKFQPLRNMDMKIGK